MAIRFIISIILLSFLGGCAITPNAPSVTLGSDWAGPEEIANATMFVKPPHVNEAKGFEIAMPSGVAPLGCKTWPNLDGEKVRVCRKATRVKIDGDKASAYPYRGGWYVFSGVRPHRVEVLSYSGRVVKSSITRELSNQEIRSVYADMASTFNCVSPMGLLYTDPSGRCGAGTSQALDIPELGVPSLNDDMERCAYAGLCRLTTNPVSYVGGAISYALSKPRLLNSEMVVMEAPEKVSVTYSSNPSRGRESRGDLR